MSQKIEEIRRKLNKLEEEAEELKRLKKDYYQAKDFRRKINSVKYHAEYD